ncbi:MAG TPA: DUF1858 domain-containing protein [Ignavibacteriaceae bacterium]|nr:DUF1858 domain-containing protein [Ignavibacteriaceae bacterium]
MKENKLITPDTKVAELLNNFPELEKVLISLAPEFVKLNNPVLRRTIARVTSLKQAARVGNLDLAVLINKLRSAVGQDTEYLGKKDDSEESGPVWLANSAITTEYDATEDLNNGIHPVAKVTKEAAGLKSDEVFCLVTGFVPAPLIDILKEKGHEVYTQKEQNGKFKTFIKGK